VTPRLKQRDLVPAIGFLAHRRRDEDDDQD
jgi:hypothetical protein